MKTLTHDQDVYDSGMAAGVEKGREEGMAAGVEKGREEGMAAGVEKGMAAGVEKGREEGREEGRINQLVELVNDGILPLEVAAKKTNMPEVDFAKLVGKK